MKTRTIGNRTVSALGLGEMPMSVTGRPDEERSLRTIHQALELGITFIDTADAYCLNEDEKGHGERLVAKALATYGGDTSDVLVATKGGSQRPDGRWEHDGSPAYIRRACEASLRALGVDAIGLYQHHRPDPKVPYADTIGTFKELHDEGKVELVGISNTNVDQIAEAGKILGSALVSVQNQYGPDFRSSEGELRFCADAGISFLPWHPLGGISNAGDLGSAHAAFGEVAKARGVSPQQVALAWELAKSPVVIPIPGSSRPETIADSARAADLELTDDELARLDAV
ncbi:MAG TPA: aldo/keto reductase [Mycobacteriales bacterium]|jgi:aryl-alcohol dehydrogenase-like predicted oxidoreductase|nr:aldo/keto reductase [Mycobacteriales bacterium]